MDTVKENQELTIGKYSCRIVKTNNWWCSNETSRETNEDIFTQFGITKKDIWSVLGYESLGSFPPCRTAEDLTKVIKFILSKKTKTVTNLEMFPIDGCFRLDGVHNDEIIKHLQSTRPIAGFSLESYQTTIAWNNSSYWGCQNSGKVEYNWEQLSKFVTTKKEVVKEKHEDYTGRTIRALVKSPQGTGVQIGEEIKILKQSSYNYVLDKTAYGYSGMSIEKPLNLKEWELLPEDSPNVDIKPIQQYLPNGHPDKISTPSIPEYVEYIDTKYKGEIVKVLDWSASFYCKVEFSKGMTEQPFKHLVKPSTKEAYVAQFKSTTFVLPKNWCVKITSDNSKVLDEWRKKQPGFFNNINTFMGWLVSDKNDCTYTNWSDDVPGGYTEITYEQFLSHAHSPVLYDGCTRGMKSLIKEELHAIYAYVGDPLPKTKPLIEDVQSVSVKLSTKKTNNKFKF